MRTHQPTTTPANYLATIAKTWHVLFPSVDNAYPAWFDVALIVASMAIITAAAAFLPAGVA